MSTTDAVLTGAVAAATLTAMHECTRTTMPDPPRADLLGMRAIARMARAAGTRPPEHLRAAAMVGDLLCNAAYYSLPALLHPRHALMAGTVAGAAAGVGLLLLPGPLHLGAAAVNRTRHTQLMGAGMYLAAGILSGLIARTLGNRGLAATQ